MNHSYLDARSCTQNTTSIAAMLHFATFMFWLERRPFSCQCTFFRRRARCNRGSHKKSSQQREGGLSRFNVRFKLKAASGERGRLNQSRSTRVTTASSWVHVGRCLFLPACRATPQTHQPDVFRMDPVWMKNASLLFTYSTRRKIFLQRRPLETWRSHARRPVTTVPTRFSIKQANNTIPTPINK